jgi:hypothetical protein
MSVSPSLEDLHIRTPLKEYVDYEISGWMETNNKENHDHPNEEFRKIRHTEFVNRKVKTRNPTLPHDAVAREARRVIKENIFLLMKSNHTRTKSKELVTPRINCKLNLARELDSSQMRGYSWHNKPLIKAKYKLQEDSFKNHLTNKSIEITKHDLTPNQKLMITQIIHRKAVLPQSRFR